MHACSDVQDGVESRRCGVLLVKRLTPADVRLFIFPAESIALWNARQNPWKRAHILLDPASSAADIQIESTDNSGARATRSTTGATDSTALNKFGISLEFCRAGCTSVTVF